MAKYEAPTRLRRADLTARERDLVELIKAEIKAELTHPGTIGLAQSDPRPIQPAEVAGWNTFNPNTPKGDAE